MIPILIITLIGLSAAQTCPPPAILYPCTCTDTPSSEIRCEGIQENFNLKEIFDNASDFISNDVLFTTLIINDTSLSAIEEGAIQHLQFQNVFIGYNSKLTYISPRAFGFNASRNTTREMALWENPIENEAPYERDIFEFISSFNKLYDLELIGSRVSSIPDNAFQNAREMRFLYLDGNNISSIGSRPFSDFLQLRFMYLNGNSITSGGIAEDAFENINGLSQVYLDCNKIDYLEQTSFQPLLDGNTARVAVGNGGDNRNCPGSEYARLHCDERAHWICDNEGKYRNILQGFLCKVGSGYEDIWEYCGARNSTLRG